MSKSRRIPKNPVAAARNALARSVGAPIRRLHALADLLRQRDLNELEIAQMCADAEQVRANAATLRRGQADAA